MKSYKHKLTNTTTMQLRNRSCKYWLVDDTRKIGTQMLKLKIIDFNKKSSGAHYIKPSNLI